MALGAGAAVSVSSDANRFRFAFSQGRLRRVWSFIQIAGRFGAGRMVAVGSAEPEFVRAVVQILARDIRAVRPRVCERLAGLDPDRVDRRGRRRGRRHACAPPGGFRYSQARHGRRAADAADCGAARARLAPRARDADAAAAGELGRRAARHVGQHALRRRHALASARGGRRAVRARAARSEVELQRELVLVRRRLDRAAVARAGAGSGPGHAHRRRAA